MPIKLNCSCGREFTVPDDLDGGWTCCPGCGARVQAAVNSGPTATTGLTDGNSAHFVGSRDWGCVLLGLLALCLLISGFVNLPGSLIAPSISEDVERSRRWICYWSATGLASLALLLGCRGARRLGSKILRVCGSLWVSIALVVAAIFVVKSTVLFDGRQPARRAQCVNNIKQIILALMNYEAAHGFYPSASISDPNGKPLLSWRVTILPFLGEEDLFRKFHLDEPWDSDHNRRLLDQMPNTYFCPAQAGWLKHQTVYQAAVGAETVWPPSRGIRLSEVTDGTAGTIVVLESDRPVPWTKPEDIAFRSDRPFIPWEATHSAGINIGFLDGSVRFEKKTIREAILKALITRNGGEKPGLNEY